MRYTVKSPLPHTLDQFADDQHAAPAVAPKRLRKMTGPEGVGTQYAALPYRLAKELEILLVTSRDTGRWVLPKGWPMKGKKPFAAAEREAIEEAGVKGRIGKSPIGSYRYGKRLSNGAVVGCVVEVFPLKVEQQMKRWPEQGQRTAHWFSPLEAAEAVDEAELSALITAFADLTLKPRAPERN